MSQLKTNLNSTPRPSVAIDNQEKTQSLEKLTALKLTHFAKNKRQDALTYIDRNSQDKTNRRSTVFGSTMQDQLIDIKGMDKPFNDLRIA